MRVDYAAYIRSPEWIARRNQRLIIDQHACRACGRKDLLNVHHKTYDRLGDEDITRDLITLCRECHFYAHSRHRQLGGSLSSATRKAITEISRVNKTATPAKRRPGKQKRTATFVPAHLRGDYLPGWSANHRNRQHDEQLARQLNGL